jgi:hypothetical protein
MRNYLVVVPLLLGDRLSWMARGRLAKVQVQGELRLLSGMVPRAWGWWGG